MIDQSIQLYDPQSQQACLGSNSFGSGLGYLQQSQWFPVLPRSLGPLELVVERLGDRINLNYGSELRLLMAEPVKGMKLREAIHLLKEALKGI